MSTGASAEDAFRKAQDALLLRSGSRSGSRYVSIDEPRARIHLLEGGRGQPVVLLHDAAMIAVGWLPLLARLEQSSHVIAPDLPGFGLSEKLSWKGRPFRSTAVALVRSLLDALELPSVHLVGNGIGGYCCLAFASAHPERVAKVVLAGAPLGVTRTVPRFLELLGTRPFNRLLFSTILAPDRQQTRELFSRLFVANVENVPVDYLDCAYLARTIPGADASWQSLLAELFTLGGFRKRYLLGEEVRRIQHPALWALGDRDWFLALSDGQRVSRLLPDSDLRVMTNVGHLPWLETPECEQLIVSFLALSR